MRKVSSISAAKNIKKCQQEASLSECIRFVDSFGKKNAPKYLKNYLSWRNKCCKGSFATTQTRFDDTLAWKLASSYAMETHPKKTEGIDQSTHDSSTTGGEDSLGFLSPDSRSESTIPSPEKPTRLPLIETHNQYQSIAAAHLLEQSNGERPTDNMPKFVFLHTKENGDLMRDLEGHLVVQALPARMDLKYTKEAYAMTLAMYMEKIFENSNKEKVDSQESSYDQITVLLDVRPGFGWPNVNATQMVGFTRYIANTLNTLHPKRLHKCIIFPMPRPAIVFWNLALKPFLDPKLRQIIELVPGVPGATIICPPPNDKLSKFVRLEDLEFLEQKRKACYTYRKQKSEVQHSTKSQRCTESSTEQV